MSEFVLRVEWLARQGLDAHRLAFAHTIAVLEEVARDDPQAGISIEVDWDRVVEKLRREQEAPA